MFTILHMVFVAAAATITERANPLDSPYVRLYNHLFTNYQKAVRPTLDTTTGTNVIVSPNLYSIINVVRMLKTFIQILFGLTQQPHSIQDE